MSHFTVLVVGDDAEKQLAPFHQFECTGNDDEFVQDVDQTEELKEAWQTGTTTRLRDPDGKLHEPYNDEFYREPTEKELADAGPLGMMGTGFGRGISYTSKDWGDGKGYRAKVRFIPEGFKEIEVPYKEVMTFTQYVLEYESKTPLNPGQRKNKDHKYGYAKLNKNGEVTQVIDRTNPNYKWDWYQLGGRWTGFFKLKDRSNNGWSLNQDHIDSLAMRYKVDRSVIKKLAVLINSDMDAADKYSMEQGIAGGYHLRREIEELLTLKYDNAKVGSPGLMTELASPGRVDSARLKDIDFEGMMKEKGEEAAERYDTLLRIFGEIPKLEINWQRDILPEDGKYSKLSWDEKRNLYHDQPAKKLVANARDNTPGLSQKERELLLWLDLEDYQVSREDYIKRAENGALATFAVLKDGKWFERGEMGWWGVVSDEKDKDTWYTEFAKLLRSLPEDTMISVYDCHI